MFGLVDFDELIFTTTTKKNLTAWPEMAAIILRITALPVLMQVETLHTKIDRRYVIRPNNWRNTWRRRSRKKQKFNYYLNFITCSVAGVPPGSFIPTPHRNTDQKFKLGRRTELHCKNHYFQIFSNIQILFCLYSCLVHKQNAESRMLP